MSFRNVPNTLKLVLIQGAHSYIIHFKLCVYLVTVAYTMHREIVVVQGVNPPWLIFAPGSPSSCLELLWPLEIWDPRTVQHCGVW